MSKDIHIGDLVRISDMVHQDGIPSSRVAVVLSKPTKDSYEVVGRNGKVIRFHECLIDIVSKVEDDDII